MAQFPIAVVVGSLRRDSLNRKLATAIAKLAPAEFSFNQLKIDDLPLYNQDDDANQAEQVKRLKSEIAASKGLLFVTPEYNRSIPGALKNAIDVGSRPKERSVWLGLPSAVLTVTPGMLGGFGANHHLRQSLAGLGSPTMPWPELYIGNAGTLIDAEGNLTNDKTKELLQSFVAAFVRWTDANARR